MGARTCMGNACFESTSSTTMYLIHFASLFDLELHSKLYSNGCMRSVAILAEIVRNKSSDYLGKRNLQHN